MQTVLFVDDDLDLCETMKILLESLAPVDCRVATSLAGIVEPKPELARVRLALLDVNLGVGQPTGLDVFHWLRNEGYTGKVVFLTGHARTLPLVQEACKQPGVELIEKPVGIERLKQVLSEAGYAQVKAG